MKRQFLKHGMVYGGANVISSMSGVLLVPIYTRALLPSEYGVVDYLVVVQSLVQICAGLEITQGIARFYSAAETDQERQAYASTGFWFLLASFAAVCGGLYLTVRAVGGEFLGLGTASSLAGGALLSVYTRILFYVLQSQARWELRSDLYSLASVVAVTCTVTAVAYLLLLRHLGLAGVFWGVSIGYGLGCAFCLVSLRRTYRPLFDAGKFREMVRFSLPLMISSLAILFAGYGDRVIVRATLGFHDLGIYGIGARLAAVVTVLINGFQLGAAPLIYRHYGEEQTPASLAQLMRLFLLAALLGVVALSAFSIELLTVLTTPEYASAWRVIPILAFAIVLASLYIFVPGLSIRNMTARFALINVATAGITLLLIAAFLWLFGVVGASIGVLCGSAAGFAMQAAASQRVYRMPVEWGRLAGGAAIVVATIAVSWTLGFPGVVSFCLRALLFIASATALINVLSTGEERAFARRAVVSGARSRWSAA